MRYPTSSSSILLVSTLFLLPAPLLADTWYEHYERGVQAVNAQNWAEGIEELNQALEKRPDPGRAVRTSGMNFINYHPYLVLGIAYFNLGRFDEALDAFNTEESLGAISKSQSDLNNLRTFRRLTKERKKAAAEPERQGRAAIVSHGLELALGLERKGRLDDAMEALGKVLAVDPENQEARAVMDRLRAQAAKRKKELQLAERISQLVTEGENLLVAGRFQEASSVLSQALSLRPDDMNTRWELSTNRLKDLLENSQAELRKKIQIEKDREAQRALMRNAFPEISRLVAAGNISKALEKLQIVLAIEPGNSHAIELRDRLLDEREKAEMGESERARLAEASRLLSVGSRRFDEGNYLDSLVSFNLAIALDPGNASAINYIGKAYAEMSRSLLGPVSPKIPPFITLANTPNSLDPDGNAEQRVSSPDFELSGVIVDDQPRLQIRYLEIAADESGEEQVLQEETSTGAPMGKLYTYRIARVIPLSPGPRTLKIVVTDPDGLSAEEYFRVRYLPPLHRQTWFYPGLAILAGVSVAAAYGRRWNRRRILLRRRFNPYVAGAPVLNEDLFVGREPLLSRILQTVHNNSILLFGERRIGKTSIQHHIRKRLKQIQDPDYDFYPVYIDLQGTPQERFFATLAEDVISEMTPFLDQNALQRIGAMEPPYTDRNFIRDVREVLKCLKKRSNPKKAKLILLIDEVDELNHYDPKINQKLRSLFMKSFAEDLVAVVSGVAIKKQWESEGSPWYNFFEEIEVKPFSRKDAMELIEKPIRGVFELEQAAVNRIIENTDCKPYLIQKVCIALVNRMYEKQRRRITLADVDFLGRPAEG